jgi:UDP-2,4-diacetamido-2,4,6-trideoxy-beta-L-altropyranose hydrolase
VTDGEGALMSDHRILFIADAGPTIGGGHVMRSLTLARALQARGAECAFRSHPDGDAVLDVFAPDLFRVEDDAGFDALVFDHYALSAHDHLALARGRPVLVIDDLADRPLGADMVLDSGMSRRASDYRGLVPDGCLLLLGPDHAPMRPDFVALRAGTLARRDEGGPVRRILVSLGLTDVGGFTLPAVQRLRGAAEIDVVVGSGAASLAALTALADEDPSVTLHVDTRDMARLTARADIAIGGGGSSSWERCVLGLPTLLLVLADNQTQAAVALAEAGAVIALDAAAEFESGFDAAAARLIAEGALRRRLSQAAAMVCDGRGADRVADAFLALIRPRAGATTG